MTDDEHCAHTVGRLAKCGYEVLSGEHGYIVRNRDDFTDISYVHTLKELGDLADLFEWAQQRRLSRNENQSSQS